MLAGGRPIGADLPNGGIAAGDTQILADASASIQFTTLGGWSATNGGSGTWLLSGAAGDYEIRFTLSSGEITSGGPVNTWLALNSGRSIGCDATSPYPSSKFASGTIEIRRVTGELQDSCSFDISAIAEV